jgi:hypothetical protein
MSKLDLSFEDRDRLFAVIGRIVVQFQPIELWLSEALASQIGMKALDDRFTVIAAMSYRQKVDLLFALVPRTEKTIPSGDFGLARRALNVAEEYRNTVVHSVWSVANGTWVRSKSTLRTKAGFSLKHVEVDIDQMEAAAAALRTVMEWEMRQAADLENAISLLKL